MGLNNHNLSYKTLKQGNKHSTQNFISQSMGKTVFLSKFNRGSINDLIIYSTKKAVGMKATAITDPLNYKQ